MFCIIKGIKLKLTNLVKYTTFNLLKYDLGLALYKAFTRITRFMKLGTKGRYAVMAMVDLALQERESQATHPIALSTIGERQEISVLYLEQLFSKLRQSGLVTSSRGITGGYRLARPPHTISIADIVRAVAEPLHATRCHPRDTGGCLSTKSQCVVHGLWHALGMEIEMYLSSVTLEDVIRKDYKGSSFLTKRVCS